MLLLWKCSLKDPCCDLSQPYTLLELFLLAYLVATYSKVVRELLKHMLKVYDVGVLAIQLLIASGTALQLLSLNFLAPISENPGSAPA